jgi:hypothetical protein
MATFNLDQSDLAAMLNAEVTSVLQWQTPFPVAALVVAFWLRSTTPGLAAVALGMALAWLVSIVWIVQATRSRYAGYRKGPSPTITFTLSSERVSWDIADGGGSGWMTWRGITVREQSGMFIVNDGNSDIGFLPRKYLSPDEISVLVSHTRQ